MDLCFLLCVLLLLLECILTVAWQCLFKKQSLEEPFYTFFSGNPPIQCFYGVEHLDIAKFFFRSKTLFLVAV